MKKLLVMSLLLSTGCTKDGGAFVCWDDDGVYDAEARVNRFSGEVSHYTAIDDNGFKFDIDDRNSRKFECITKAESDRQEAETKAKQKVECERAKKEGNPWTPSCNAP